MQGRFKASLTPRQRVLLSLGVVVFLALMLFPKWSSTFDKVYYAEKEKGTGSEKYDTHRVIRTEPIQRRDRRAFIFSSGAWDFSHYRSHTPRIDGYDFINDKQWINVNSLMLEACVVVVATGLSFFLLTVVETSMWTKSGATKF